MSLPRAQQITIFSKSGRNSTQTRHLLLPIIRAALSLNFSRSDALLDSRLASRLATSPQSKLSATRYILEGEMVPFNEEEDRIDEFWKLATVKHNIVPTGVVANSQDSVETGFTGGDGSAEVEAGLDRLHLMIVWFDVLLLDGETLLDGTSTSFFLRYIY
jgi:DNA ligase-4